MRSVCAGFFGGLVGTLLLGTGFHHQGVQLPAGQTLSIAGSTAGPGCIRFLEDADNGSNYVEICAPASIASDATGTWPVATGDITFP